MIPRCSGGCVKLLLQVTVILIIVFSTSSTKQCKPTSTEGDDPVIIRNVGIKLCQLRCDESGQCLSIEYNADTLTCRLLRAESRKIETKEGYVSLARNRPDDQTGSCSPKMCSAGQRCLKTRSGKSVCVQDEKQNYPEKSPQYEGDKEETLQSSSLHDACRKGNLTRVRFILSQGLVDINSRDGNHGKTPLMVAAQEGHCRLFTFLIRNGANMSQVDNDGKNTFHWACKGGHAGILECLLPQYRTGIKNKRVSPLMHAAFLGKRDLFDFLVCMGANVSLVDYSGRTVLHLGCRGGHLGIVKYLLSLGSLDINSRINDGRTPLMIAAYRGHSDVLDFLMRKGANVSQVDGKGNNILHWGCRKGHLGMVKYLLSLDSIDINSRGRFGRTPLMIAVHRGHTDVFDFLVRKGANVSHADGEGNNILHFGCRGGHLGIVKYLLSLGSLDINSRINDCRTPLMIAAYRGHSDVFDFLVRKGANVSQVDQMGSTVLHLASLRGHVELMKHIVSQSMVDIKARDKDGKTAAMRSKRNPRIYYLLVSRGCPVK